ncbi:MAG: pyruvate kinase [Patescibacteria group bacterium]
MTKATKIVATIGPATESIEIIRLLIENGMNVARFNTKHSEPAWHLERIKRVHQVAKEMNQPIAILLDLQGPEIRINLAEGKSFPVVKDEIIKFCSDQNNLQPKQPQIPQAVIDALSVDDSILIDDGLGEFIIKSKEGNCLNARALSSFEVKHRKTLNTPGVTINLPTLIDQDKKYLDIITNELVDYIGLSFVRTAKDIEILRAELKKRNLTQDIVAKIENQSAIDHLEEIIIASDAVMVARGDLAVEISFQKLTYWQKTIIYQCRQHAKPVITATQMLMSMVDHPRPTRAEVSDVANAIYDGTDAVMLSEETTIGKYPVEAVATQATIAEFNEQHAPCQQVHPVFSGTTSYMTQASADLVEDSIINNDQTKIDKIVCLTETGQTAKMMARFRPKVPIIALTSNPQTYRKMSLLYDVTGMIINLPDSDKLESSQKLLDQFAQLGIAKSGDQILLAYGTLWKKPGLTNSLTLLQVP